MILQSKRVWILNQWMEIQVEFSAETGKITGILPYGAKPADLDVGDLRVVPGFIDVHTHGAYGFDTNDAEEEGLKHWLQNIVSEGVTGILPTTITQSEEVLTKALKNVAKVAREQKADRTAVPGAEILGIHFEGPYLSRKFKGAQPEEFCVAPDLAQFRRYLAASDGLIRIVTLACEQDEGYHVTHVYNGMAPFHHRNPGIPGAAFRFKDVFGEIICDGLHSDWASLYTFFTCKGPDYGVMISDALRFKGLPVGTQMLFGGNLVELCEDGSAHLAGSETLAGSTLRINEGLRNLVEKAGVPWQTAINSCTINPARLIGLERKKGSVQAGKDADLVVLRDDYSVEMTICRESVTK